MHRLLPTLRQLLRATEPTALIVMERLMNARPDLDKLVRWVPSDGTIVPVCSSEVAARIVSILLGKVDDDYKAAVLTGLGFSEQASRTAIADAYTLPQQMLFTLSITPPQAVHPLPFLDIGGLPTDFTLREMRLLCSPLPGYVAFGKHLIKRKGMGCCWFATTMQALQAAPVLRRISIQPDSPCPLTLTFRASWDGPLSSLPTAYR